MQLHTDGPTERHFLHVLLFDPLGLGCTAVLYLPFRLRHPTWYDTDNDDTHKKSGMLAKKGVLIS